MINYYDFIVLTRHKLFAVLLPAKNKALRTEQRTDRWTNRRRHPLIELWLTTKNCIMIKGILMTVVTIFLVTKTLIKKALTTNIELKILYQSN